MTSDSSAWEKLLAAERHLQALPVLVGGTAAALHAGHRQSLDGDHVLTDLRDHFDEVLASLESVAGWTSSRVLKKALLAPWNDWKHVASVGQRLAGVLSAALLEEQS